MDKKITIGILGLGEGRSIISAVLNSDDYMLGNICDLDEELCKERCKEFNLSKYTTSYDEMLEDDSIDVIGVYTPDQLHAEHIKQAWLAGKDVICTKPVVIDLLQAKELMVYQKQTGKNLFVGQSTRFFEPLIHQRADFEKGKLGELISLEAHYRTDARWFLDKSWTRKSGFSWMYNFMIHSVDLAVWYLDEIEEVFGYGYVSPNTKEFGLEIPDTLNFLFKDKQGRHATVGGIYTAPTLNPDVEFPISCTLRGTKGISRGGYNRLTYYSKFPIENPRTDKNPYDLDAEVSDFYDDRKETYEDKWDYYFRFEGETHHAGEYQNYIEYYARSIREGIKPKPDIKEALRTIAVMEAMKEALKSSKPVKVSKVLDTYGLEL